MKVTKLLLAILLPVMLNSCKVHRQVQKSTSRTDSTATSTSTTTQAAQLYQQLQSKRLDSSRTSGQSAYQRQTITYNFTPDTGAKKANGLENRLTGITVTTEQGTQATQADNLTRQNTDGLTMAKDTTASQEKKKITTHNVEVAKQSDKQGWFGTLPLWLIILLILIVVLTIWKGKPIVALIAWLRKLRKNGMPNTPA